jgi:hypothetical protein
MKGKYVKISDIVLMVDVDCGLKVFEGIVDIFKVEFGYCSV